MSAEHGSIEPILTVKEKQLRFSKAISRLEAVQPILGTPENINKPNLGLRIDLPGLTIKDKIGRRIELGDLRSKIGQTISQIRGYQSQLQAEINEYLFDGDREVEIMGALLEQGLLGEREVGDVKSEYEILRRKLTVTSLDQLVPKQEKPEIVEAVKPVEPEVEPEVVGIQEELERPKKKHKKSKTKLRVEKIEQAYPQLCEIINSILTRWEEQGKNPEQRIGGNVITDIFKNCGVSTCTRTDEKKYLEKRYAESEKSNDHHQGYNQFETTLFLCWIYCNQGSNWNTRTVRAIKQIIKEEIQKRKSK